MSLFRNKKRNLYENNFNEFNLDDETIEQINNEYSDENIYSDKQTKPKPKRILRRIIIGFSLTCVLTILINLGALFYTGKLWFNQPDKDDYPIRGAFVDSNLGQIRWDVFSRQNLSFAYIRATKSTSFIDERFVENWGNSLDSDLLTGAYHTFKLSVDGEKQAKYFCEAMGDSISGRLIPAVEFKLTGIYAVVPTDKDKAIKKLSDFCSCIEAKYGVKPLIICNERSYEKYILGSFDDYPLCVTDVFSKPDSEINWNFWCYNNRVRVKGYENSKEYFSMLVFKENIDSEEFKNKYLC